MGQGKTPRIALVWAQFAAYHVDRCEAVARRFADRADLLAVEVATTSTDYSWEPSGAVAGAAKLTMFPGRSYEAIGHMARIWALFRALRRCDWVMIGLSYAEFDVVILTLMLRLCGVKLVVLSESKFDDRPRKPWREWLKRAVLSLYHGAIVGGARHRDYFRYLGFRRRPVLPGYDGVGLDRVRRQGGGVLAPHGAPYATRPFVFVGRFVDKKNLHVLVAAHAAYALMAGEGARRLVLAGSGPEEASLRARIADLGTAHLVDFTGFLPAAEVSKLLAGALALVLVSVEEQWGLVVNEALAFGLPVIVSTPVGARDLLVRDGVNGFVVDPADIDGIARALHAISGNQADWERMAGASHQRSWLGDSDRLADAVAAMVGLLEAPGLSRMHETIQAMEQAD
ncbi:MAG: glycosyltransferase [Novosphingobium sp.]